MSETIDDIAAMKLFKAIILQAFKDACMDLPKPMSERMPRGFPEKYKPRPRKDKPPKTAKEAWRDRAKARRGLRMKIDREREEARRWLLGNSPDFHKICEMAGWDPLYIRRGAHRLRANGWRPMRSKAFDMTEAA